MGEHGRDVDDRAGPPRRHEPGRDPARDEQRAEEVHVEHAVPIGDRDVESGRPGRDAGAIGEAGHGAAFGRDRVQQPRAAPFVRDVDRQRAGVRPRCPQGARLVFRAVAVAVGEDHPAAVPRQPRGNAGADAGGGPGDERDRVGRGWVRTVQGTSPVSSRGRVEAAVLVT